MFKEKMNELMTEHKIGQRELAKKININESSLSRYLSGERQPRIDILIKLSNYFNITIEELVSDDTSNLSFKQMKTVVARNSKNFSNEELSELISILTKHIKDEIK